MTPNSPKFNEILQTQLSKTGNSAEQEHARILQQKIALKEQELKLREGLPFLYGWKWYPWARTFFESHNKLNFLCAANQISKSSTQIRKAIYWATTPSLWASLWRTRPVQFWYLYPTGKQSKIEFETKWKQFLPRGEYKEHPVYGWREEFVNKELFAIHFNSGVHIYFKTYAQETSALQTGTCFVAGTKIYTRSGPRRIEDVRVGDDVLSKDGWTPVVRVVRRQAQVITRYFPDGTLLRGTPDHPVWTQNRGWVALGDLRCTDKCVTIAEWVSQKYAFLMGRSMSWWGRRSSTQDADIISYGADGKHFTSPFGRSIISGIFLKATSFIIGMRIRRIIGSRISSSLLDQNTPRSIGKLGNDIEQSVGGAPETSWLRVLKKLGCSVLNHVEKLLTSKSWFAFGVGSNLRLGRTPLKFIAPTSASTEPRTSEVFNLEVGGSHTFFANGVLTHNCDAIFCDEELPIEHFDELMFRLSASDGYFHMVFTATLGQLFWREVMEPLPHEEERLPEAHKQTVSLYDAQKYEDGTPSHWVDEKIQLVKNRCSTHNEVLKRVYGRFVKDEGGRKCEAFDIKRHMKKSHPLPKDWLVYGAADIGSGGKSGHPAAIAFVAVDPTFRQGRVFLGWRGDGIPTTAGDVVEKFRELKKENNIAPIGQFYDWASRDFLEMATRMGEPFQPAEKAKEKGEEILNVLFKNDMLAIYETPELNKLAGELFSLMKDTDKKKAKDDFYDALRYCVMGIPWDWSVITGAKPADFREPEKPMNNREREIHERRQAFVGGDERTEEQQLEDEFDEWNDLYG